MVKNKKLLKIFHKNLKLSKKDLNDIEKNKIDISLNKHPRWDSLMHVKILSEIEKKFKINVNEKYYLKFTSIKKIKKLI